MDQDQDVDWTQFDGLIESALEEDGAAEDVTTQALIPPSLDCQAGVIVKESGVICGLPLVERLCALYDESLAFDADVPDGTFVDKTTRVATCSGPAVSVLTVERVMLNLLQRLSGVASLTHQYVETVRGTGASILDTRKTTPGWRVLEKYAVRCGGGDNHRMGLHDMVLIKDNHLKLRERCGQKTSIPDAIKIARSSGGDCPVEVEVENLSQLREALPAGPDFILLDNMSPREVKEAVMLARRECDAGMPQMEASGAIGLDEAADYGEAGVDRISVGALTHSAMALDISLQIIE